MSGSGGGVGRDGLQVWRDWLVALTPYIFVVGGFVLWVTGGIHPQSQTQYDELSKQVAQIQATLTDVNTQIRNMPRPTDYQQQDSHLSKLDAQISEMDRRITADEISAAAEARAQRLMDQMGTEKTGRH